MAARGLSPGGPRDGMIRAVHLLPQEPVAQATPTSDLLQQLQALGWVDHTAIAVLLVFFVIGLFKGLIWQVSRVGILVVAYVVAGRFGQDVADLLTRTSVASPNPGDSSAAPTSSDTTIYLAYVLLFLVVLIALSLLAIVLQKLAAKAGLGFFDRLGGGVLGVATGGCVVLFGLFVVHMFFRGSQLAMAASESHSLRLSRQAVDALGPRVPDELRQVFALQALRVMVPSSQPTPPAPDAPASEPQAPYGGR